MEVPLQPLDQLVRYLVVPPQAAIDSRLGKALPAFRLPAVETNQTNWNTSEAAGVGQVQVLIWLADHPSCRAALDQLRQALSRLPEPLRQRVAPVAVWAEAAPPSGMTFASLKKEWQIDMPIVLDDGQIGRDILAIAEAPALIVLDSKHRLQLLQERGNPTLAETLPDMLHRLIKARTWRKRRSITFNGNKPVTSRTLARPRQRLCTRCVYQAAILCSGLVQLDEVRTLPIKESIAGFQVDAQRNLWLVRGDGQLLQINASGKVERELAAGLEGIDRQTLTKEKVCLALDDACKWML